MGKLIKGAAVVLPFPFSNLTGSKRRPAFVLADLEGDDAILCQITSQAKFDPYAVAEVSPTLKAAPSGTNMTPSSEFDDLVKRPLVDRAWIADNREVMYHGEDGYHCLLALGEGYSDGVLIEAEGYNYPRKAAYVPDARAIAGQGMGVTKLRDLMMVGPLANAYLTHTDPEVGFVDAGLLDTLTDKGREEYAALLNARVVSIRSDDGLPEIVLAGIEPQTLLDFYEAAMDHRRAELQMGDMTP
jgi:hypothetical protein